MSRAHVLFGLLGAVSLSAIATCKKDSSQTEPTTTSPAGGAGGCLQPSQVCDCTCDGVVQHGLSLQNLPGCDQWEGQSCVPVGAAGAGGTAGGAAGGGAGGGGGPVWESCVATGTYCWI